MQACQAVHSRRNIGGIGPRVRIDGILRPKWVRSLVLGPPHHIARPAAFSPVPFLLRSSQQQLRHLNGCGLRTSGTPAAVCKHQAGTMVDAVLSSYQWLVVMGAFGAFIFGYGTGGQREGCKEWVRYLPALALPPAVQNRS